MKKKLPIGISTLNQIIPEGFVYVDKTWYLYELVDTGKYYFLSRPRRFGKTLFLDTLKEAFQGNKELFKGLYIYDKWDWGKKYPVIHISFAEGVYTSRQNLDKRIYDILLINQEYLEVDCRDTEDVLSCFIELIRKAKKKYGQNVVILIDEYDKPILDVLPNVELAKDMREGLKNLYSVIKGQDANIKFVFMTGVSKFSKVSLFSGLNNLNDITIHKKYSSICGYTEDDLQVYFKEHLEGKDIGLIRTWYNGYSWTGSERVYNPFSILKYLEAEEFGNYWFETATPTFLIELFKARKYYIPQIENLEVGESLIGSFDIDYIEPENLLFQTGYLTIQSSSYKFGRLYYTLSYPNFEVRVSLSDHVLNHYSASATQKSRIQMRLIDALQSGDIQGIKEIMQSHFASIPHDWYRRNEIASYEGYYASVFYSYFASLGFDIKVEDTTNHGNIDMTVLMQDKVLIFEFKVIDLVKDKTSAIEQIKKKNYQEKYQSLNLPIYLIGIEFNSVDKNIIKYEWQQVQGLT